MIHMKLKRSLSLFLLIAVIAAAPAMSDAGSRPTKQAAVDFAKASLKDMTTVGNASAGVKIDFPKNWEIIEKLDLPLVVKCRALNGLVSARVGIDKLPPGTHLGSYSKATNDTLKSGMAANNTPITILKESHRTLPSGPAIETIYSYKLPDAPVEVKVMQVLTLKNGRGYVFNYTAHVDYYDEFLSVAQAMVESLKLV